MPLIETSLTPEERAARTIKAQLQRNHVQTIRAHQELYKAVWQDASGLTGQQVMDAIGKDAGALIDAMTKLVAVPNQFLPDIQQLPVSPKDLDIAVQPDGTVKVSTK